MNRKNLRKMLPLCIITLFITLVAAPTALGTQNRGPELEITAITGGFGKVCIEITNTGDVVAEEVVSTISVSGGLYNRIDVYKQCSGCGQCNSSILPGEVKTECTDQFIFGFGALDISATANATGVSTVEQTAQGFIIGPFLLIQ